MTMKQLLSTVLALAAFAIAPTAFADDTATAKIFTTQCATCHGADGKGQTTLGKQVAAKDWSDPKALKPMSDVELEKMITGGKKMMPAFTTLGEPQIKLLVTYVRSFEPK